MPRVTITLPEKTPQPYRFDLKREVVTIGRGQDNDIVVGCGSVSGKHSEMQRVKGGYHLIDVGSTNGIKIDGIRHQTVVLHTGMTVKLGDVEFGFTLSEEELEVLATESEPTTQAVISEKDDDASEKDDDADNEEIELKELDEHKIPAKPVSKEVEKKSEAPKDDDLDKLPDLPPVRLDKRKQKEAEEAEKEKKARKEERAKKERSDDGDDESEKPKKREKSARAANKDEYSESKAVTIGSGFILFALIAVAAAFFYGANTRHEKDTGENLLKGIVNKEDAKSEAPTEVEDKADGGAE